MLPASPQVGTIFATLSSPNIDNKSFFTEGDGSAMSSLFGTMWFQFLFVACTTICFCLLYLVIAPFKASLIRALRVWMEAQDGVDHHNHPRSTGSSGSTPGAHEMPIVQQVPIAVQQSPEVALNTTIGLGSGKSLSKKDLLRGLLCSLAVYLDNGAADNIFNQALQEFPTLDQFVQVHMSFDHGDWKFKYLVAYAKDAIFIAFRGTETLVDLADDLTMTKSSSRHGGKFHEGFLKRSELFLGPNNKLDVLLQSGKRIILCGHSLGGAVAHMVLLRYLLEKDIVFTPENPGPQDSLFSIAFGAPHVCDVEAAGIINEDENMKWRFINIVNQADPVPRYLHHLPSTLMSFLKEAPGYFSKSNSILAQFGGFAGKLMTSHATGQAPDLGEIVRQVSGEIVAHSWEKYVYECSSTLRYQVKKFFSWITVEKTLVSEFHPVGQYVFLTRTRPRSRRDEWGPWKHNIEHGQNREMTELRIIENSGRHCDLENHTLMSYKAALIKTSILDSPQLISSQSSDADQRDLVVSTPNPVIIKARFDASTPEHRLYIKGQHLLFLYEPIRVNNDHKQWQILHPVTDTELNLVRAGRTSKYDRAEPAMPVISVKTAFGRASKQIFMKESVRSKGTQSMLRTVVQVLALKASPPMNRNPHADVLRQLDFIVQCAMGGNSEGNPRHLSPLFSAIQAGAKQGTDITEHIEAANNMIEKVLLFLLTGRPFEPSNYSCSEQSSSSSATDPTSTSWGKKALKTTGLLLVGGAATVAGAVPLTVFGVSFVAGALYSAAVMATQSSSSSSSSPITPAPDEYQGWLELAIEEASRWRPDYGGRRPLDNTVSPREPAAYEKLLLEQVEASPEFKGMVEHSYCTDPSSYTCTNRSAYRDAMQLVNGVVIWPTSSALSVRQVAGTMMRRSHNFSNLNFLLQRINIVLKTHALYKEVVEENFVAVVGAEDAGKSTFIKEVMEKFGSPREVESEMPKTGVDYHTKDVRPYQVTKKLCMVDFPGENGIGNHTERWQQFGMLPGSSILFLNFEDDLKIEQKQMYETMKQGLEKNPIVVFNKVDEKFTPERENLYTSTYFKEKGEKVARELECDPKDVYYLSVRPNGFHNETSCRKMLNRGVLDLETFADKVLDLRVEGGLSTFQLCS